MSNVCVINKRGIEEIIDNLNAQNRNEAIYKALVKGGEALVKETKEQLRKELPRGATSGKRYGDALEKGVKLQKDKHYDEVKVHIMGDYRLKFFELGTADRYTRKSRKLLRNDDSFRKSGGTQGINGYRGKIDAKHFFQQARENDTPIIEEIIETLQKEINKLTK